MGAAAGDAGVEGVSVLIPFAVVSFLEPAPAEAEGDETDCYHDDHHDPFLRHALAIARFEGVQTCTHPMTVPPAPTTSAVRTTRRFYTRRRSTTRGRRGSIGGLLSSTVVWVFFRTIVTPAIRRVPLHYCGVVAWVGARGGANGVEIAAGVLVDGGAEAGPRIAAT